MSALSRHARQYGIYDGDEIDYDYEEANEPYDRDYDPRDDHPPELIYYDKLVEYSSNLSKSIIRVLSKLLKHPRSTCVHPGEITTSIEQGPVLLTGFIYSITLKDNNEHNETRIIFIDDHFDFITKDKILKKDIILKNDKNQKSNKQRNQTRFDYSDCSNNSDYTDYPNNSDDPHTMSELIHSANVSFIYPLLLHINSERKKDPSKWSLFTPDALRCVFSHVKNQYEYNTHINCSIEYMKYDRKLTTCIPSIDTKRRFYEHILDTMFLISDSFPFYYFINQLMNLECSCYVKQCMDEINNIILEDFKNINDLNIPISDLNNMDDPFFLHEFPFVGITPNIDHNNDVKRLSNSNYSLELITRIFNTNMDTSQDIAYVGVITDKNNDKKCYFYRVEKDIKDIIKYLNWCVNNAESCFSNHDNKINSVSKSLLYILRQISLTIYVN